MDARPLAYNDRATEARGQTVTAGARRESRSFEPEPQRGDAEERKEPDDIRHRRYEHARRDRRIGVETMEHERHQNAAERPCQEIADHGEADHQAEIGHLEPRCRCNAGDDREGQTVDQPHEHLAQDEARGVGARQFVHRERADRTVMV